MGMTLGQIKTVNGKIEQGFWFKKLPGLPGVSVLVRNIPNSEYTKFVTKIRANYSQEELQEDSVMQDIFTQAIAETVLINWEGIDDMPFSKQAALQLLTDPETAVFKRAVDWAIGEVDKKISNGLEADLKN